MNGNQNLEQRLRERLYLSHTAPESNCIHSKLGWSTSCEVLCYLNHSLQGSVVLSSIINLKPCDLLWKMVGINVLQISLDHFSRLLR